MPSEGDAACSFCGRHRDVVHKLIGNPSEHRRAYICDECVSVCVSVIDEAKREGEIQPEDLDVSGRFVNHPLAPSLLAATERWAIQDLRGMAARDELSEIRNLAAKMLSDSARSTDE